MIKAVALATPELGDRSYLLHDGHVAAVIDPQRDIARVLRAARAEGVRIACVAETHIHNDYVSGGRALSQQLGVPYLVAAEEAVDFARRPVRHGDIITVGASFSLGVFATPGHTLHHVSYVALEGGLPVSVCTGGSMLFGSAGRTDLSGASQTVPLAARQYRTLHRLGRLPDEVAVLPTHGFGSFCAVASSATVDASTIAEQRAANLAFRPGGEDAFVAALIGGLTAYPSYYRHMAALNLHGMPAPEPSPPRVLDAVRLGVAAQSSAWVVDLRPRTAFARAHLARTINVEHGTLFTTYLGWLLPEDTPLVLVGESRQVVAGAQRDLARIGIDHLAGRYVGRLPSAGDASSYPIRGFRELHEAMRRPGVVALDVRRQDEWDSGHLDGALHLPLHELGANIREIPRGTVWVHCAAGFRAGIAASLLERAGRQVVLVNDVFVPRARVHEHEHERPAARVA
jgi:glyoxylase-like metal-dependent hydrolase (beta-lactamase superfamily II)/rhodanese-related sulfurtransferase